MTQATTPRSAAKRLNDHHAKTAAGFYASTGGRFADARVRSSQLEVLEVSSGDWLQADLAKTTFRDHNGRPIHF